MKVEIKLNSNNIIELQIIRIRMMHDEFVINFSPWEVMGKAGTTGVRLASSGTLVSTRHVG